MKNEWIEKYKIVGIMRKIEISKLVSVGQAAYDGGLRIIELPFEQNAEDPIAVYTEKIKVLQEAFGDKMLFGAGTVLTVEQVEAAAAAGAKLIVTPNTNPDVILAAKRLKLTTTIGAATPTEIELAYRTGADYVKLFPAGDFGPGYLKSVSAPLEHVPIMAVGGIDASNIAKFAKAGACAFGVGSPLFPAAVIKQCDYSKITEIAKELYVHLAEC